MQHPTHDMMIQSYISRAMVMPFVCNCFVFFPPQLGVEEKMSILLRCRELTPQTVWLIPCCDSCEQSPEQWAWHQRNIVQSARCPWGVCTMRYKHTCFVCESSAKWWQDNGMKTLFLTLGLDQMGWTLVYIVPSPFNVTEFIVKKYRQDISYWQAALIV